MSKERALITVILVALVIAVAITYYRTVVLGEFTVINIEGELEESLE